MGQLSGRTRMLSSFFQLVQQVEGIFTVAVQLVHENNHRRIAHTAHFL